MSKLLSVLDELEEQDLGEWEITKTPNSDGTGPIELMKEDEKVSIVDGPASPDGVLALQSSDNFYKTSVDEDISDIIGLVNTML